MTKASGLIPGTNYSFEWEVVNLTCTPPAIPDNKDQTQVFDFLDPPPDGGGDAAGNYFACGATMMLNAVDPSLFSLTAGGQWVYISGSGNVVLGEENLPNATVENLVAGDPLVLDWEVSNPTIPPVVCFDSDNDYFCDGQR